MSFPRAIVITGPTATGKTRLAVQIAREFQCEILSLDSRQVFQGLDIGTGKDLQEYGDIPYHLIDIVPPQQEFHLFEFLRQAKATLLSMEQRKILPVLCGGTPLYLKALLDGYDQEGGAPDPELRRQLEQLSTEELLRLLQAEAPPPLFERTDKTQRRRIIRALELAKTGTMVEQTPLLQSPLILAPYFHRTTVRERIAIRLDQRLANGLVEEVQTLHETQGLSWERMEWLGLEYRFVARYLQGQITFLEMRTQLFQHICQFAKHQDCWFRKLERDGHAIHWLPAEKAMENARKLIQLYLDGQPLPPPEFRLDDIHYTDCKGNIS